MVRVMLKLVFFFALGFGLIAMNTHLTGDPTRRQAEDAMARFNGVAPPQGDVQLCGQWVDFQLVLYAEYALMTVVFLVILITEIWRVRMCYSLQALIEARAAQYNARRN